MISEKQEFQKYFPPQSINTITNPNILSNSWNYHHFEKSKSTLEYFECSTYKLKLLFSRTLLHLAEIH